MRSTAQVGWLLLVAACGAREGLDEWVPPEAPTAVDTGHDAGIPEGGARPPTLDAGPPLLDAGPRRECSYDGDFAGWTPVDVELPGGYRYMFGAMVGGRLRMLAETNPSAQVHVLDLDVVEGVPVITARLVLPGASFEPYGFAADEQRFVAFEREVATNDIAMRVYDLAGNVESERGFGIGSFINATAALTADGAVTFAVTLLRDGVMESLVERRSADDTVELSERYEEPGTITLALRGARVELVRGEKVFEVSAAGVTFLREIEPMGVVGAYSGGWFGIVAAAEGGLGFRFEPEVGPATVYFATESAIGSNASLTSVEHGGAIVWWFGDAEGNEIGVLRSGSFRKLTVPMSTSSPAIAFANGTDVGLFLGSGFDAPPSFRYWGLHCP